MHKKAKELEWLLAFQAAFPACPCSTLVQPEPPAPDGFFPEARLGIEITEYSLGQTRDVSFPRQQETVHQRIAKEAQSLYEKKLSQHLQVSVLWTVFNNCPTLGEEKQIATTIARQVIRNTSARLQACRVSWETLNEPLLTKYGIEVNIYPIPEGGRSCWSSLACFAFPAEATRIQAALSHKESKVVRYRKTCDRVWLLIVASSDYLSSQFTPDAHLALMEFDSSFDRVFLLEEPGNWIREFQVRGSRWRSLWHP